MDIIIFTLGPLGPEGIVVTRAVRPSVCLSVRPSVWGFPLDNVLCFQSIHFLHYMTIHMGSLKKPIHLQANRHIIGPLVAQKQSISAFSDRFRMISRIGINQWL